MLNRIVPTPAKTLPAVRVFASTAKTSRSGRLKETVESQLRPIVSTQFVPLNLTMMPTSGAGSPRALSEGPITPPGAPAWQFVPPLTWKPSQTTFSSIAVVRLPEWNAATNTVVPSVARPRGVSAKNERMRTGLPPTAVPGVVASKTQTSARPTPSVASWGSPAPGTPEIEASVRCWPRCAVLMKARFPPVPANTMSRGSSPTSSVRETRGGVAARSTMLTLSERWFTTQTSVFERTAIATGSMPTGTENAGESTPPSPTLNTSSRLSWMFVTNSRVLSGDSATGRTGPLSNSMNEGCANAGRAANRKAQNAKIIRCMGGLLCGANGRPLYTEKPGDWEEIHTLTPKRARGPGGTRDGT